MIIRLMKKQPGGTFKKAGYMSFKNGQIYVSAHEDMHNDSIMIEKKTNPQLGDRRYLANCYIPHDRIDRYTGVKVDGVMLFERDKIDVGVWEDGKGIISFVDGAFVVVFDTCECYLSANVKFKIIGYEGDGSDNHNS